MDRRIRHRICCRPAIIRVYQRPCQQGKNHEHRALAIQPSPQLLRGIIGLVGYFCHRAVNAMGGLDGDQPVIDYLYLVKDNRRYIDGRNGILRQPRIPGIRVNNQCVYPLVSQETAITPLKSGKQRLNLHFTLKPAIRMNRRFRNTQNALSYSYIKKCP